MAANKNKKKQKKTCLYLMGYTLVKFGEDIFTYLGRDTECDRQTYGRTDRQTDRQTL